MLTAEAFLRHAERFGWEMVRETAADCGIDLRKKRPPSPLPKRTRRSNAPLQRQVLELHGRGLMPLAIADVLNLSDRRVQRIINKSETSANRHETPAVHAGLRS